MLVRFLPCEVTPHPASMARAKYLHKRHENRDCSLFVYLLMKSFIYIDIDSQLFILYFRLQLSITLLTCSNCSSFAPLEIYQLAPVSLRQTRPPSLFLLLVKNTFFWGGGLFLTFWQNKMLQAHPVYPALFPESATSQTTPCSFC